MAAEYVRIAANMRELIKSGLLPAETRLSERKLAEKYGTGRSTISAALKVLKDEGFVDALPKSGTRVSSWGDGEGHAWSNLLRGGISAPSSGDYKDSRRCLIYGGKKGVVFGFHNEFEPYMPLRKAFKTLSSKTDIDEQLNTFDDKGLPVLRETLAWHLKNYGINSNPDNIVVFNGYLEAVYTVAAALLSPGANLYYTGGDMIGGMSTMRSTGVNMREIPVDDGGPVTDGFKRLIKPGRNLFYANPVNSFPSGLTYDEKRMKDLTAVCVEYDMPVLENDFLRDLWIEPPPAPLKALDPERVIYVGSMINSYVTGVRMGWAALPARLVPRIYEVKMQMNSGNSSGAELIVNEILSSGYYAEFCENIRKKLPFRAEKVNEILSKHLGKIAVWNPKNVIYTVRLEFGPDVDADRIVAENPYFIMKDVLRKNSNAVYTNALGMTLEEFEDMAVSCARSVCRGIKKGRVSAAPKF